MSGTSAAGRRPANIRFAPAIALRDWRIGEGWDDLFLDLDPERGIAAGERWKRAALILTPMRRAAVARLSEIPAEARRSRLISAA